jgi:hypothetical protein
MRARLTCVESDLAALRSPGCVIQFGDDGLPEGPDDRAPGAGKVKQAEDRP